MIFWVSWNCYQVRVSVHESPRSSGDFLFPNAVTLLGGGSSPTTSKPLSHGSQSRVVFHSTSVKMSSSCLQSFIEWLCHLLFKPGHGEKTGVLIITVEQQPQLETSQRGRVATHGLWNAAQNHPWDSQGPSHAGLPWVHFASEPPHI